MGFHAHKIEPFAVTICAEQILADHEHAGTLAGE